LKKFNSWDENKINTFDASANANPAPNRSITPQGNLQKFKKCAQDLNT
jgi:hypothetical protein